MNSSAKLPPLSASPTAITRGSRAGMGRSQGSSSAVTISARAAA